MRIIALDIGDKRTGVAVSDESEFLASEYGIIDTVNLTSKLKVLIKELECKQLVIGLPLAMSGNDSEQTRKVRTFARKLSEDLDIPHTFIDERLTTSMTKNLPGGKENKDSLAAKIILQIYLDKSRLWPNT